MCEPREWIIQRCTQQWIGTQLQYEDWPAGQEPVTAIKMLDKLEYWQDQRPDDEFRGHNTRNCQCHRSTEPATADTTGGANV